MLLASRQILLVAIFVVLVPHSPTLVSRVTAASTSTAPQWFQHRPALPTEPAIDDPNKNNSTAVARMSLQRRPQWLQRVTNGTLSSVGTLSRKKQRVGNTTGNGNGNATTRSNTKKRRWFFQRNANATAATLESPKGDEKETNQTSAFSSAPDSDDDTNRNNQTSSQPHNQTQQQTKWSPHPHSHPQQAGGIIVMGTPYSYGRGRSSALQQHQQQQHQQASNNFPVGNAIVGQVLGTAIRLWLLTWLTKRLATQEETMLPPTQHFCWERLNDKFQRDTKALQTVLLTPPVGLSKRRWKRHLRRQQLLLRGTASSLSSSITTASSHLLYNRTVVVVDLDTDAPFSSSASSAASEFVTSGGNRIPLKYFADVVTFLLQQQRAHAFGTDPTTGDPLPLEVVLLVQSPGGAVSTYGWAAAQLQRLRSHNHNNQNNSNIVTTVCVDQFAASGGYMIASQADRLVAAPFATLGSVGVIVEGLNFNELARRYGIQPLVLKAGESKNSLSTWGPVRKKDLEDEQRRLEKVHEAFIELVVAGRPGLAPETVPHILDGSVFLGTEALELGLIDAVQTTDDYLWERINAGDRVLKLHRSIQHRFLRRPGHIISPLDILPHLRTWVSRAMGVTLDGSGSAESNALDGMNGGTDLMQKIVQVGGWLGFAHHMLSKYAFAREH